MLKSKVLIKFTFTFAIVMSLIPIKSVKAEVVSTKSLHSYLTHIIAYQGPTASIPTILAGRERDSLVDKPVTGHPLLCEFNENLLMFEDYPEINEYNEQLKKAQVSQNLTDQELLNLHASLKKAYLGPTFALGLGSQQGAYLEIDRTDNIVQGQMMTVSKPINIGDLDVNDRQFVSHVNTKIQNAERVSFRIKSSIQEVWETEIKGSHSYIFEYPRSGNPEADLLIGEVRIFENWNINSPVNGYALFLVYDKNGFLIAFNRGFCSPPVF